jgi:hypothetical protein
VQLELLRLGIAFKHSRPYHPQTCGKVERFHQTLKIFLAKQEPATTIDALQEQIDRFVTYYNEVRPHRARERMTPRAAYDARDKASPSNAPFLPPVGVRVRLDRVDKTGVVTLRHSGRLRHIAVGRDRAGVKVRLLINGLEVRVITEQGELLRKLTLDLAKDYQGTGRPPGPPKGRYKGRLFR